MADNVTADAGSGGAVFATDDVGGVHYPIGKIAIGALDAATLLSGGNGATDAGTVRVTVSSDSTGVLSIDDNGGAITVDGTVTANLSATDNAVLDTIDAVLDTINAKLVTGTVIGDVNLGATDNAVLDAIAASVAGTLTVDMGANNDVTVTSGTVTANLGATDNAVLDAIAASVAGTLTVDMGANNDVTVTSGTVTANLGATDNAVLDSIDAAVNGTLSVDLGVNNDVTVTSGTVTANLGATDNAVLDTIDAVLDTINAKLVTGTVIGDVNLGATDNAVLDAIAASVAGTLTVDMGANNDVTVTSGTITANLGATDNAVLDTIDSVLDTINAKLVTGTVIGDVNLGATDNAVLDDIAAKVAPRTSGGISTVFRDEDIDETAVAAKASAGQVYWIHCINLDATPVYLHFYDVAQGSVTVGTTAELMSFAVPSQGDANGAGFTMNFPHGVEFGTAITVACTTTIGGSAGPAANEVILNVGYE